MRKLLVLFSLALIIAAFCYLCLFTLGPSEVIIITQFGKHVRTVEEAGLHIKYPAPIQTVNRLDKRLQAFRTKVIQQLTSDKKSLLLQSYCCWRIRKPLLFLQSVASVGTANARLGDIVNSEMGALLGNYELSDLITLEEGGTALPEFEERLSKRSSARAMDLFGIEIKKVGIRQLSLPAENARAVFNRMKAERSRDAARYRAEGEELASAIQAKADREKAEILAEANRKAEVIKGEADAKAAKIYAEAYNADLEFFNFLKSLEVYKDVLGSNTYLVLSSHSELFAEFFSRQRQEEGGRK